MRMGSYQPLGIAPGVIPIYNMSENMDLAKKYGVRVAPTVVIDGEVKIEGRPDIMFVCSEESYEYFKSRYPMPK